MLKSDFDHTYVFNKIECPVKMNEATISSSRDDFQDQDPKTEDIGLDRESPFHCILRRHITTEHNMIDVTL